MSWWYWWMTQPMFVRIFVYVLLGYCIGSFIGGFFSAET